MKKTNNKKGFTIVELIIVIAVIAILAAVLIPTFAGVVDNAKEAAALQTAQAAYKEAYAKVLEDGKIGGNTIEVGNKTVGYYEVQTAGDLSFVFISEDGSVENLTVNVCEKANTITVTGAADTENPTKYTYTCNATAGEIDGYKVTVTNGVVSVSK